MDKVEFFEVKKVAYTRLPICGSEKERGLDEDCECGGKHKWFVFPNWSEGVKEGGKSYLQCINCFQMSHL